MFLFDSWEPYVNEEEKFEKEQREREEREQKERGRKQLDKFNKRLEKTEKLKGERK